MDWKVVEAVFVLVGKAVKYIFTHKVTLILLVTIIVGVAATRACSAANQRTHPIPVYQQDAPDKRRAPNVLQTTTQIYYVQSYSGNPKTVITLRKYYWWDGKKWNLSGIPLTLDSASVGEMLLWPR